MFYIPFISYYGIYWTNLLMVAKMHNVLVLYRNHLEIDKNTKKALLELDSNSQESVSADTF